MQLRCVYSLPVERCICTCADQPTVVQRALLGHFRPPALSFAAARELSEWAAIYIRYVAILRKLEIAFDQMVHPQKRLDMKRALEACMGRMLVSRRWGIRLPALLLASRCARHNVLFVACAVRLTLAVMAHAAHTCCTFLHSGAAAGMPLTFVYPSFPLPQEIRHWLVKLNRGLDFVHLDDVLVDLKLTPEVLEVPVPRCFTEDRVKVRAAGRGNCCVLLCSSHGSRAGLLSTGPTSLFPCACLRASFALFLHPFIWAASRS